jgi:hypothetical protein
MGRRDLLLLAYPSFGTLEMLAVSFGILHWDFEWEFEAFLPLKLSGAGRDGDWGVDERDT